MSESAETISKQQEAVVYHLKVTISKEMAEKATRLFWIRYVGWDGIAGWAAVAAFFIFSLSGRDRSWLTGAIGVVVVAIPGIWLIGYFTFLNRALGRFRQMDSKVVEYTFSEQSIASTSDLGMGVVPWKMLKEVWCLPDMWFLFFGKTNYVYLPPSELNESARAFIVEQAKRRGAKIRR